MIVLKETEKRKTEVIKGTLVGASFNPDQDADNDGENDFIELAKHGLNAEVKRDVNQLNREKFEHQKVVDDKKIKQVDKKLSIDAKKINIKKSSS